MHQKNLVEIKRENQCGLIIQSYTAGSYSFFLEKSILGKSKNSHTKILGHTIR